MLNLNVTAITSDCKSYKNFPDGIKDSEKSSTKDISECFFENSGHSFAKDKLKKKAKVTS